MKNTILTLLCLFIPVINLFAQVPPPPTQGEDAFTPGTPNTPVDQYVIILILAAVLFGTYFLWSKKKLAKV